MRVLTDPAETGAVTLALPQDVQAEAYDWPEELFARRVWTIRRQPVDQPSLDQAVAVIRAAERPVIVAGGGVIYSRATDELRAFAAATGIPVAETQAGKGSLAYDDPRALGAVGATGTTAADNLLADADVVIGVGTRYSDFTTASQTVFGHPDVRFVNLNVASFDAHKQAAVPLLGDARAGLEQLRDALAGWSTPTAYQERATALAQEWDADGAARVRRPARPAAGAVRRDRRGQRASRGRRTSWSAPPAPCRETCTSSGGPATPRATTSSTASPAWATRSPAVSA